MIRKVVRHFRALTLTVLRRRVDISGRQYSIKNFYLNPFVKSIILRKSYEVTLNDALLLVLSLKEGAFLDVGANIGQTLIKLLSIDSGRRYVGFEPQVSCCTYIDRFITDNGLTDHTILPIGLSDKTGIAKLGTRRNYDAAASMVDEYRPAGFHTAYCYIPVVMGDEIVEQLELDAIAVVKVDVEGGEFEVFKGLSGSLAQFRPFLIFELLPHYLLATNTILDPHTRTVRDARHQKIDSLIRSLGYAMFRIEPGGRFTEVSELKAAERENHNYLGVPQEHVEALHSIDHGDTRLPR